MKYLDELRALKLPSNKFAVFGSGPLAIRGLRENRDLDVCVKADLFKELLKNYKSKDGRSIVIGKIEIWGDWLPWFSDMNKLIDSADIIDGIRFVNFEYLLKFKKMRNSEKDKEDIRIIEDYLKSGKK